MDFFLKHLQQSVKLQSAHLGNVIMTFNLWVAPRYTKAILLRCAPVKVKL